MKSGRRDAEAIVRENAQLQAANAFLAADNASLRANNMTLRTETAKLMKACQVMVKELSTATLEHHHPNGSIRRGPFFDVLGLDSLEVLAAVDMGDGGQHVE